MSHFSRDPFPAGPDLLSRPAPARSVLRRWRRILAVWRERAAMRRTLAQIDRRTLHDIGVRPGQAAFEASQPFWRRPNSLR